MVVRWEELRRITDRNPANRQGCIGWQRGAEMDDPIDADLRSCPQPGSVKNSSSGRNKDRFFDDAANEVGMRPNQGMLANGGCVASRTAHDSVFHHHAVVTNSNRSAF